MRYLKRAVSILLCLLMIFGMFTVLPITAGAEDVIELSGTISKQYELSQSITYRLTGDITANAAIVLNNANVDATLDLNGYTIDRGLTEAKSVGFVIGVNKGKLTITDSSTAKTGKITGGYNSASGGGIFIINGGRVTIEGGSITGNAAANYGGGVCLRDNTCSFSMTGGSIVGNRAASGGGGIYIEKGSLSMTGGTIADNTAPQAGGVLLMNAESVFEMYGGSISGNSATKVGNITTNGGGAVFINNCGTFTMSDGTIADNSAASRGGGVVVAKDATFNLNGGSITGNTTDIKGGGIIKSANGILNISGGSVTDNTLSDNITPDNITLLTSGTSEELYITGQLSEDNIYGVSRVDSSDHTPQPGVFTSGLSGKGSAANFVSDSDDYAVTLNGSGEAQLVRAYTVTFNNHDGSELQSGKVAANTAPEYNGETPTKPDDGQYSYTFSGWDNGTATYGADDPLPAVSGNVTYTAVFSATVNQHIHDGVTFGKWTETDSLPTSGSWYLAEDVTLSSTTTVSGTLNLCLDGRTVTYTGSTGAVFVVDNGAVLNLYDSQSGTGKVTGGKGHVSGNYIFGGCVYIGTGRFRMYGGTISGNTAKFGGGVLVYDGSSVFEMYGGSISGNTATNSASDTANSGGAVFINNYGTFTMSGGTITGNTAARCGGGIVITGNATFNLNGGSIAGNTAGTKGGGIIKSQNGILNISGGSVTGNTGNNLSDHTTTDNITLITNNGSSEELYIKGRLSEENIYGVSRVNSKHEPQSGVITSGLSEKGSADNFISDSDDYIVALNDSGEARLVRAYTVTFKSYDGDELQSGKIATGAVPVYTGETPTRDAPSGYVYVFSGWSDGSKTYGVDALPAVTADVTYTAHFILEDTMVAKIGSIKYETLNAAMTAAKSGDVVILLKNYMQTEDLTIPAGVTLLVPYDDDNTVTTDSPTSYREDVKDTLKEFIQYRCLNLADGVDVTVNGTLIAAGDHYPTYSTPRNSTVHAFGRIDMADSSTITVNNGAKLYAWGYITGGGSVVAESGATVYELMQLYDFRGFRDTYYMRGETDQFPFNQYYIQNIESALTVKSGATEKVFYDLDSSAGVRIANLIDFIGANGLFRLGTGASLTKHYDSARDIMVYDIYGAADLGSMSVNITYLFFSASVDSSDYYLPINALDIHLHSGASLTTDKKVIFLPGSSVTVDEGASIDVKNGGSVIFADKDIDKYTCAYSTNYPCLPVAYSPTRPNKNTRTWATTSAASLDVNGSVTVEAGGAFGTTPYGAKIYSSTGSGTFTFKSSNALNSTITKWAGTTSSDAKKVAFSVAKPVLRDGADGSGTAHATDNSDNSWWFGAAPVTFSQVDNVWGDYRYVDFYTKDDVKIERSDAPLTRAQLADYDSLAPVPQETGKTYTFTGWDVVSSSVDNTITGNVKSVVKVKAAYDVENIKYSVTFVDEDGTVLKEATEYDRGTAAADIVKPADPTKAATAQYTYTFSGWSPAITDVTGDQTYTATYSSTVNEYTITWMNGDDMLKTEQVAYGATPSYTGAVPTKPSAVEDDGICYLYTFSGWSPEIAAVTGSVSYMAQFTKTPIFAGNSLTPQDDIEVNFYVDLRTFDHETTSVKLSWGKGVDYDDATFAIKDLTENVTTAYADDDSINLRNLTAKAKVYSGDIYKFAACVAAKQMRDKITVEVYEDGEVVATSTYCVADYCNKIIENEGGAVRNRMPLDFTDDDFKELQTLCKAMLDYGAKAQTQFGYNTENPADYRLAGYTYDEVQASQFKQYYDDEYISAPSMMNFYGPSLQLESETTYVLWFRYFDGEYVGENLTATIHDPVKDEDVSFTVAPYVYNAYYIRYNILNLPARLLTEDIKVNFNGTTLTYNAQTYFYGALSGDDETLKTTVRALYNYNQAAKAYYG